MTTSDLWPLSTSFLLFIVAGATIGVCGVSVTRRAEQLAAETGIGQAIMGAVFLGAMTSLGGLITSVTAALDNHPQLSVSNAVGGIAIQTTFLVLADLFYPRSNLEHAAASEANLVQATLLIALLAISLLAGYSDNVSIAGVHPATLVLLAAYALGLRMIAGAHHTPMWQPVATRQLHPEQTQMHPPPTERMLTRWLVFLLLAGVVAIAGWVITRAGLSIAEQSGMSEGLVGILLTGSVTSIPEAVIAIAAVRRGALSLAVGDIIGGNTFDVLFLSASDIAYRPGSIYHAVSVTQSFWLALSLLMSTVLLMGLIRRQTHGPGNIGFESALVLALYVTGVTLLVW